MVTEEAYINCSRLELLLVLAWRKTGPCSLSAWQCAAVHHRAEEFVHCSCAVVAAVAEA